MFEDATLGELTEAVTQLNALANVVHAQVLAVLAEIERREGYRADGALTMTAWVATTCNTTTARAREWVQTARALQVLPALAEVNDQGRLSQDQLAQVTRYATPGTDTTLAREAPARSVAELRADARTANPPDAPGAAAAHARRALGWRWADSGEEVRLWGRLPAAEGALVIAAVEGLAAQAGPDITTGTYDPYPARCADALVTLATAEPGSPEDGTPTYHRPDGTPLNPNAPPALLAQLRQRFGLAS